MNSRMGVIRLTKEFKRTNEQFKGRLIATLDGDDLYRWNVELAPFDVKRYGEKRFAFSIEIPSVYPLSPPRLSVVNSMFHPNVDKGGKVCLATLSGWTASCTMNGTLEALLQLLREPNFTDPVNASASKLWDDVASFSKRAM